MEQFFKTFRSPIYVALFSLFFLLQFDNECLAKKKKKKRIKVKLGSVVPEGTPWSESGKWIKKRLEKNSNKKFRVKLYFGGTLGDEKNIIKRCKKGSIQMYGGSIGNLANEVPLFDILELPFMFNTLDEIDFVLDEVAKQELKKAMYEKGFVLMEWTENGWRNFATIKGFIKSPKDLKGLRMRSQENPIYINTWKAFGASPLPIGVTEVLSSLQVGVVDGFDQTLLFTFATSWYQGIKYYSVSRHIHQAGAIFVSRKFYDKLPQDLQDVMMNGTDKETVLVRKKVRALSKVLLENLRKAGVQTYTLTDQERQTFVKPAQKVQSKYIAKASPEVQKLYRKITAALKKRRGK